jgi:ADP-ribosylarginine hydrolase
MSDNKYVATMILHAVGDTIGFKNGKWEFNENKSKVSDGYSMELIFKFIALGGINDIDLSGWIVSDDTILHIATASALLEENKDVNKFGALVAQKYIKYVLKHERDKPGRAFGFATIAMIRKIYEKEVKWNEIPYDFSLGGSGAAMRTHCIGLHFNGEKNRDKLISFSIEASRVTHNSAVGYLGGLCSALFTAYAIEKVPIKEWPFKLMELLQKDGLVEKYLKKTRGFKDYEKDKYAFINKWMRYINDRFESKEPVYPKSFINPTFRSYYYRSNFSKYRGKLNLPGSGGDDSVILAYDTLLESKGVWEKIVFFSMLHVGDSDTTGCIAGAWYGAVYGIKGVPKSNYKYLEMKDKLIKIGEKI